MPSLGMTGPFSLDNGTIDAKVAKSRIGNYALGHVNSSDMFIVKYVGRSDACVNTRLKSHVGKHPKFKFSYASSQKEAFEKECNNYHDFGGPKGELENDIHPARPDGTNWKCPRCSIFG